MSDKEYICAYKHCLHHDSKVKASESVVIGNKHYHWDCAAMKQEIKDCIDTYMELFADADAEEKRKKYPILTRTINTLVFKNKIPPDYITKKIQESKLYYASKPVHVLYGLRKMFWEIEK